MSAEQKFTRREILGISGLVLVPFLVGCETSSTRPPDNATPVPRTNANTVFEATVPPTRVGIPTNTPFPTPDTRPEYLKDIVSKEVLQQKYHTTILDYNNTDDDFVRLSIREPALKTEPFNSLKDSRDSLTICLIGGPTIHPKYLTKDQKALSPRLEEIVTLGKNYIYDLGKKTIDNQITQRITEYNTALKDLIQKQQNGQFSNDRYIVEKLALDYVYKRYLNPDEEDFIFPYLGQQPTLRNGKGGYDKFVLLPVKEFPDVTITHGREKKIISGKSREFSRAPSPDQSFVSPDDLTINRNYPTYTIRAGLTPGTSLRHELVHTRGIDEVHTNEHITDNTVIDELVAAHDELKRTGSINGYPYVFTLPHFTYVVTEAPKQPQYTSNF